VLVGFPEGGYATMSLMIDDTHDLALASWVDTAQGHANFPVQNLPLVVFKPGDGPVRLGTAIGEYVLDLGAAADLELIDPRIVPFLRGETLNRLLAMPPSWRQILRRELSSLLCDERCQAGVLPHLYPASDCVFALPAQIGDYTDFYVGIHHATNVGRLFRPDAPLLPNYKFVPIGYHGRSSSVRPSGEPVTRPSGQLRAADAEVPGFGPSRRLDFELELGIWVGEGNALGRPIPIDEAPQHIAGFCLLNDWSARDIQAWEYQPLGPFLSKSFQSTVSPFVITPEAMAPFRQAQPDRPDGDPQPLPYLWSEDDQRCGALGLDLQVLINSAQMRAKGLDPLVLSTSAAANMYWTVAQLLTHHTSNGCNLRPGDLLGTGTISGPTVDSFGSLLEISNGGKNPVHLPTGETRTFLEDGDEIILRAQARREGYVPIGFGDCRAIIQPAVQA
jgi:fumarylacetoacetase